MKQYQTRTGERKDVLQAALESGRLNPPTEYIGNKIFPMAFHSGELSGDFNYQTLTADGAAQTSRTAGSNLTNNFLTTTEGAYRCAGYEKRYSIERAEVKSLGGIDNADMLGISAAARSVYRAYEELCGAAVIDATGYAARYETVSGKVLEGLSKAAQSVKRYKGKTVLACSEDWYLDFIGQTDVKAAIQATFGNAGLLNLNAMLAKGPEATIQLMIAVIQFSDIIIGDNDHWQVAGMEDAAAVMRIPDPNVKLSETDMMMLYKEQAVYGISHFWLPDPSDPELLFYAESEYDGDSKDNKYDVTGWFQVAQLNAGAKKLVSLPSQTYATTTTTTTS